MVCAALSAATVSALVAAGVAHGLWSASVVVEVPTTAAGEVAFGADAFAVSGQTTTTSRNWSQAGTPSSSGTPLQVVVPGTAIAEVVSSGAAAWRFGVAGFASGLAGLAFDVDTPAAKRDTVLDGSTVRVWRDVGTGCEDAPEQGQATLAGVVLQEPGAFTGALVEQQWCVSATWNHAPDSTHLNVSTASALAPDGSTVTATASWQTTVQDVPALPSLGWHTNVVSASAVASDGTVAQAIAEWRAEVVGNPSDEPDLTIAVTPHVTSAQASAEPPGE
ncbi:hypothetical protein GCM10007967_26520 [Xylanimonas ulmi]